MDLEMVLTEIEISTGADIWKYRAELFPNLQFCEAVSDQLQALQTGSLLLPFIKRKLFELEEVSKDWQKQEGAFDLRKITGRKSPESEATLSKYGQQHTFRCPDGEYRIFSLHVWITQSWRLHFFPVVEERRIIVGYIGEHLPTKKYT